MFSFATRAGLSLSLLACVATASWFRARQNRAGTSAWGGRISPPKLLWLFFCIWFWLFECAVLAFEPALPWAVRLALGLHALSMWVRGGVEMFMLYVTKNWRPPIGIGHDVFCLVTVLVVVPLAGLEGFDAWSWALVGALVFSLVVETVYAALFFDVVKGKTMGDDPIWFASEEEARFKRINRLTTALNVPQVAFQLVWLGYVFTR